jgi:hypothetical protein
MEANTITLFFKEIIITKETTEVNGDVEPTLPMLEVVENCFQPTPTPPFTNVGPIETIHKLHAQARKKKTLVRFGNMHLLLALL